MAIFPAVYFPGNEQGLDLDFTGGWFDPSQDWSYCVSFGFNGATTAGKKRTVLYIGTWDGDFLTPYVSVRATDASNDIAMTADIGGGTLTTSTVSIVDLDWNSLSVTYEAATTTLRCRVNGVALGTLTADLSALTAEILFLGFDYTGDSFCNMFFADARLWQNLLTDPELDTEAAQSFPGTHVGILNDASLMAFDSVGTIDIDDKLGHQDFVNNDYRGYFTNGNDPQTQDGPDVDNGLCIPGGTLFVAWSTIARFYDADTGYQRAMRNLPIGGAASEYGRVLRAAFMPDGSLIYAGAALQKWFILTPDLGTIVAGPLLSGADYLTGVKVASGKTFGIAPTTFYLGYAEDTGGGHFESHVTPFSMLGVAGPTIDLPLVLGGVGYSVTFVAVSPDESVLYHAADTLLNPTSAMDGVVAQWDIGGGTPLSPLITITGTESITGLYVMPVSGNIVVASYDGGSSNLYISLRMIQPDGTVLWNVQLPLPSAQTSGLVSITSADDDSNLTILWPTQYLATLQRIDPTDGSVVVLDVQPFNGDVSDYELSTTVTNIGTCSIAVSDLTGDCTENTLTLTGTDLDSYSTIAVTGPDGEDVDFTVTSVSNTTIVLTLDDPITAGQYCVTVDDLEPVCVSLSCTGTTYPICRKCRFPLPFNGNLLMFLYRLEFLIQSGVSPNASITINLSRDGGYTWPITRTLTAGALGAYDWRVYSTNFGQGRNWVCEFITSEPYFWALIQCYAEMEQGTS